MLIENVMQLVLQLQLGVDVGFLPHHPRKGSALFHEELSTCLELRLVSGVVIPRLSSVPLNFKKNFNVDLVKGSNLLKSTNVLVF
jgi:hypothetical protein